MKKNPRQIIPSNTVRLRSRANTDYGEDEDPEPERYRSAYCMGQNYKDKTVSWAVKDSFRVVLKV